MNNFDMLSQFIFSFKYVTTNLTFEKFQMFCHKSYIWKVLIMNNFMMFSQFMFFSNISLQISHLKSLHVPISIKQIRPPVSKEWIEEKEVGLFSTVVGLPKDWPLEKETKSKYFFCLIKRLISNQIYSGVFPLHIFVGNH